MKINWLLEYHFVRGNYVNCQKIIEEKEIDNGLEKEYSTYVQARIHCAKGNLKEALQLFQVCNSFRPGNSEYLKQLGKILIAQGRYKKATAALNHAQLLVKQPDFDLQQDLAICHANLKEYALAEENCSIAIKISRNKSIYKLLTTVLIGQNKVAESIEVFRLALRLFPKSSSLYTRFGKMCVRMRFEDEALRILSTAIKLKGDNISAINELALLHQNRGEIDEAINLYRDVLLYGVESVFIYNNLGICYYRKHKYVLALTCLHLARDFDPLSTETLFNLGIVYASLRQYCSSYLSWKAATMTKDKEFEKELILMIDGCLKQQLA